MRHILEWKAGRAYSKINKFLKSMEKSRQSSETLKEKVKVEIEKLDNVIKTCEKVEKFIKKVLD
jgi:hypothetical protein